MNTDLRLADLFAAARTPQLEWDGAPAHAIYELSLSPGELVVEFLETTRDPVQGLALSSQHGTITVNGAAARQVRLWRDTAPDQVSVRVDADQGGRIALKIWNVWRGEVGGTLVEQAWLGNAGMRVEQCSPGEQFVFRCSDGVGEVDFGSLIVRLTISERHEGGA